MKPRDVIRYFGTQQATAEALGVSQQAVANWVGRGFVPIKRQLELEYSTNGKLKAERKLRRRR